MEDRAAWLAERTRLGCPVIVATAGDKVFGYASFAQWQPHSGYRHTLEPSVYVRDGERGHGIGRARLKELIARTPVVPPL